MENGLSKSAQTFTVGFIKLLSTHQIHIVVWGNFPFKDLIIPGTKQDVLNSPNMIPMSVGVVPRDTDISSRKTPMALRVPTTEHPWRKSVSITGKHSIKVAMIERGTARNIERVNVSMIVARFQLSLILGYYT